MRVDGIKDLKCNGQNAGFVPESSPNLHRDLIRYLEPDMIRFVAEMHCASPYRSAAGFIRSQFRHRSLLRLLFPCVRTCKGQ